MRTGVIVYHTFDPRDLVPAEALVNVYQIILAFPKSIKPIVINSPVVKSRLARTEHKNNQ